MSKENLKLLRKPFPKNQISKLPKPTKAQTDAVKKDYKAGIRCNICGGWHHPKVIHLDYVGHAALTDRLLDVDPEWSWKPMALTPDGLPLFDKIGGLWIELTVCGVTRYGYGCADGKQGGDAVKEVIGDAIRNAAMRFGAALELWHKGKLHVDDVSEATKNVDELREIFDKAKNADDLTSLWKKHSADIAKLKQVDRDDLAFFCKQIKEAFEGAKNEP